MLRYVLFPGRHHVLTRFQAAYLRQLLAGGCADTAGRPVEFGPDAAVVWIVTSANHRNTRRNPVPFDRRQAAIERLSVQDELPSLVVGVPDKPSSERFADTCVKSVIAECDVEITPANTVVACSTPSVAAMYAEAGYRVVSVEADADFQVGGDRTRPGDVLIQVAQDDAAWRERAHPATVHVFDRYHLSDRIVDVFADPVVGDEGSLTESRDYRTYIASFEAAADRKWGQARPYVRPGRIVDVGCATGAMLSLAAADPELAESDLYGLEVARHLYEECVHAAAQGRFGNPNTFFLQANLCATDVFPEASIDTTLSFALTHEIFSYGGGQSALSQFVDRLYRHTTPGGVWINSDVCGPTDGDQLVRVLLRTDDGVDLDPVDLRGLPKADVMAHLATLSARGRFRQFTADFAQNSPRRATYDVAADGALVLPLRDAMDVLSKLDYTDNWLSESHETFCFLDGPGWSQLVEAAGFEVDTRSGPWRNDWFVENRLAPFAALEGLNGRAMTWPDTHILLVARRPQSH